MLPHWTILLLPFAPLSLARRSIAGRGHLLPPIGGYEHQTLAHRQDPSLSAPSINFNAVPSSTISTSAFIPDPSAVLAASHNTTALQYVQYLDTITTNNCTMAGGGCEQFQLTLGDCVADDCICQDEYTLAAMICAQCIASKEGIMVYNTYLNWCDTEGIADPTDTFGVSMEPSGSGSGDEVLAITVTSTSTIMTTTQVSASTSAGTSASGSGGSSATGSLGGVNAIQLVPVQSAAPISSISGQALVVGSRAPSSVLASSGESVSSVPISGRPLVFQALQISGSAGPSRTVSSLASNQPSSAGSRSSASGSGSNAGSSSSGSPLRIASIAPTSTGGPPMTTLADIDLMATPSMTSGIASDPSFVSSGAVSALPSPLGPLDLSSNASTSTSALNAAIAFFSAVTVMSCEDACSVWKGLSNTCTQDTCICTAAGVSSAASCSSCVGSGSNGATPPDLQANYAAFTGNCTAEVGSLGASGSISPSGFEIVAAAESSSLSPSGGLGGSTNPSPTVSLPPVVNAAEQAAVVTVTKNHANGKLSLAFGVHGRTMLIAVTVMFAGGMMIL